MPNLRKSVSSPSLARKPEGASESRGSGLNFATEREIGSIGGIDAKGKLTVGVDNLISQQGVSIEVDATNKTVGFGAGIGSTRSKLGVNIGGKVKTNDDGSIDIKEASAAINIAGLGIEGSADYEGGRKGAISIAGAKVEIGVSKDGKKSLSLCYGVPGGEFCVTFEPDPGITVPAPAPTPISTSTPTPIIAAECHRSGKLLYGTLKRTISGGWKGLNPDGSIKKIYQYEYVYTPLPNGRFLRTYTLTIFATGATNTSQVEVTLNLWPALPDDSRFTQEIAEPIFPGVAYNGTVVDSYHEYFGGEENQVICLPNPNAPPPTPVSNPAIKIELPNYPQHYKPMECCDLIKEIYQYLGIAKLKKNKFPVSNAFLVPGGSGNDNCLDYYSILQAYLECLPTA
ncbi:hypothetical protein QUA56_19050 [Microcoleus sp. N3A4]|uniref:hypothetical protein n=1 Tax=Microcoleus sp. N3A4 TaxID=3055379 RepID=UPI002FD271B6